jgi:K+-sensing histidine kinase KdpD
MSRENLGQSEGNLGSFLSESDLAITAASELSSPLVLLRQLGLAVAAEGVSDSERKKLGQQLTLTSERALRLAGNLSLVSNNQPSMLLEPINPISVCQEVIHELSPLFMAHGQTITLQQRSRSPLLVANRQLLQRILLGFGDNALHYGSVEHPVRMMISGHGDRVRIGVRDYGPAVPIDMWQQLEGRVARRSRAPLGNRPHTSGIGLIAARRLAEMMDSAVGTIRHQDGATFYVDLRISGQMSLL